MSNDKDFKVKNGIQPTAYHEAVGTVVSGSVGYSLAGASYDSVSFSVASQETNPLGLAFNNDGTKMYVVGSISDTVYQYPLSTAFDLSTASYDSVSFSVTSQEATPTGIAFNNDGTKMYIVGATSRSVHQYSLPTAFDLSTASYDSVSFSFNSQDTSTYGIAFNNAGTKIYMVGNTTDSLYQYSLSTAFDVSTVSYDNVSFSVASQDTTPRGVTFNTDGTKMLLVGVTGDNVYQYSLSTAFDLSTASYDSVSFSVAQDTAPSEIVFNSDGTKMYIVGATNDTIYQYSTVLSTASLDLSTGSVFELTPTSDLQVSLTNPAASGTSSGATLLLSNAAVTTYDLANAVYDGVSFSVAAQEINPHGLFFKPDGTKMYIVGPTGDDINEYNLSTPWNVSTASFLQLFSVAAQETFPQGLFFKPDGTKMYIVGWDGREVNEYNLSTPWDVSTASYLQLFSVAAQETSPTGIFFKPDGTKMYVSGTTTGDRVYEYNLSTPWNVSTAVYLQLFSVAAQDAGPEGLFFKDDGTKMYVVGSTGDDVNEYNLSTPWDITTASFLQLFSVAAQDTLPTSVFFKPDGTKMYIVGVIGDKVYQYSTAAPATITYDTPIQFSGGTAPTAPAIGDTDVLTFNTTDGGTTYKSALAIDGAS